MTRLKVMWCLLFIIEIKKKSNLCFNERQNIWTTRYDWNPIISENINGKFFSIKGMDSENTYSDIWIHSIDWEKEPCRPTNWYDEQHEFEFEFVVSDPVGVHKVFDNLQIISNNTQPSELEITIIGDSYVFNRKIISGQDVENSRKEYETRNPDTTSNVHEDNSQAQDVRNEHSPYGNYKYDKRLNQYALTKWQPIKDIYDYGRRIGNTQYKEDSWYTQIEPILIPNTDKEARIRDKWARIRIRYNGEDLAVITAIRTLINV